MAQEFADKFGARVLIRLDTLIRLRWYAIIGQAGAVLVVAFGFGYDMPWGICLFLIAVSAALNLFLNLKYKSFHRLPAGGAFGFLAFDIVHLGLLLYLTGGLQNPFSTLLIASVVVSSTSLTRNHTLVLGALSLTIITLLLFFHKPLPWSDATALQMPFTFIVGVWVAIVCTLAFTSIYAYRVAEERRKLADALTASELVLQRENYLSTLDGIAAAAAHELGTPLATIALVSKEMLNALPEDSAMREDAILLRSQAQRCREILEKMTSLSSADESIMQEQSITALVEEAVAPLRDFGIEITITHRGDPKKEPSFKRNPGVQYGLGNLIDNAVDFAKSAVNVSVVWNEGGTEVLISDDGPGFPNAIMAKLGEPFVTSRKQSSSEQPRGMGLGLFIAKTLLERNGASLMFANVKPPKGRGARVCVLWPNGV